MEFLDIDLRKFINLGPKSGVTKEHIKKIVYNTLCALRFLHKANVLHRDIKTSNIFLTKTCEVKIGDFGISRSMPQSCIGKGSGNSKRVRDSILKQGLNEKYSKSQVKAYIDSHIKKKDFENRVRSLSNHVSSRWYRAPEVSLM